MATFILAFILIGSFFVLMSVRILFLKNGEFKGTCASQNPFLVKEGATCSYCGKTAGSCETDSKESENEVNKVISKF